MPTAALIVGANFGGAALSAGGQLYQGFQANKAAGQEATQLEQQGQVRATEANARISAQDQETRKVIGGVNAGAAASGVSASSGSPGVVNKYNASMGFLRDTYAKYQSNMEERNAYYAAKASRWQGGQALLAGAVGAGSTALTSYFNYKGMKQGGFSSGGPPLSMPGGGGVS
jgi:predicted extracellular nuclease